LRSRAIIKGPPELAAGLDVLRLNLNLTVTYLPLEPALEQEERKVSQANGRECAPDDKLREPIICSTGSGVDGGHGARCAFAHLRLLYSTRT
jgi:hypothetical protein